MRCKKLPADARLCAERERWQVLFFRARIPSLLGTRNSLILRAGSERAAGGTLWNHAERDRFRAGDLRRSFRKIKLTRGGYTFDVPAVGGEIEIRLENLRLGVVALELKGINDLL